MQEYINLNSNAGGSFGPYQMGNDEELFKHITSAFIACGFHAGDPSVMRKTLSLAKQHGIEMGPHLGYPDLQGFGRRNMEITPKEAADYTTYQIGALQAFAKAEAVHLSCIKLHGAFYVRGERDQHFADAVVEAISKIDNRLILIARDDTQLSESAKRFGVRHAPELAIDRARKSNMEVVSRLEPNAVTTDPVEVANRVERIIKEGKIKAVDGKDMSAGRVFSFCVHGDNPNVFEIYKVVRARLTDIGIKMIPLKKFFD